LSGVAVVEGDNRVVIEAFDAAGNRSATALYVVCDTIKPAIVKVIPSAGSLGVPVGSILTVEFSENIDRTSLTQESFYLERANHVHVSVISQ
jgi:hypothetical protein